ncbi:MAG: hypothetical protein JNL34_01580, partial [Anaerolineae bacterium]|nr:hypothetical protein [Anaerolineae bacterium]
MSADQGLPPAVPPPGDDEAPEPVVLPPWLQGADEPAEPATEVPLPPPPSGLPPPPAPRPSPPSGEDAPTQMMPVPELPPWLQGTGELQQPADAPHAADWVESPAAPPDAADAALTYDEWAAWQKKLAQPHDVEEDLPDLTAEIEESPAAAPGTSALQDAASLPGWFLGLEEISEEELPGWFMETGELGDEPPAAPVPEPAEWADSPFAAGALPADMGDELPDLTDWAGDGEGGEASTQPVVSDDFPFDMEAAPEPAETVESPALDAATEALMAAAAAGTGDFDEPVFEWVSTAGEEAVPPDDDIDEPELDEFLAPPPEASSAPLMDNQTTQDWLTELEGMVADVGAPDSGAATLDPSLEAAAGESEEDWQAAFGFDRPAPPEPVDEPDLYEFLNDAPAEVAETPAAPAAPEPEAPAATDFDELLGPALMAGGAAGFVTSQPQAETVAEPADELTADVLFSDLAEAQAATAPEAEPEAEPAADLSFDVLFGDLLEDDSAAEPDAAPEAAVAADDLTSEAMDIASTPEGEPVLEPADKLALAAMFASSIPDPEAEAPPADNQTVEAMAAVSAPEIEPEPELADSVALAAMFGSGTPEQEIEAPAADDLTIEAMTAVPAPEIEPEPELADSLALAALFADSASGPEGETESEVEPTDDLAFETLFGAEAASEFAASSPEADAESADEPDFETLFGAEAASEFVASTPEPEDESEAELADDLTFEALVGGTGVAAGIAASAPDDEAESADEPDFETLFGAETASEVAASMPEEEAESADEPDFETRLGAEAEADAEQTDDLTFEALLGGAVVAAGIAA